MVGKSIRLFLADGSPHGLISAEIGNWSGRLLVVAQADLAKLARRDEARRPGVYLLAGIDPDKPTRERVYVGESENIFSRLVEHNRLDEKDFWTRTALILSKDENLTKSHIRYLESRIIREVKAVGRFLLDNRNQPDTPPLPESDMADMEGFLSQVRILLPVLGFNLMQRLPQAEPSDDVTPTDEVAPLFEVSPSGLHATMQIVGDEFVVQKGSTARKEGTASWDTYRSLRDQLVEDGILVDSENRKHFVFAQDYAFASPSAAATAIYAGNQNGRLVWKHKKTGQTYKDWQETRLRAAGVNDSEGEEAVEG